MFLKKVKKKLNFKVWNFGYNMGFCRTNLINATLNVNLKYIFTLREDSDNMYSSL